MTLLAADREFHFGELDVKSWTELATWVAAGAPRSSGRTVFTVDHEEPVS